MKLYIPEKTGAGPINLSKVAAVSAKVSGKKVNNNKKSDNKKSDKEWEHFGYSPNMYILSFHPLQL